MAVNYMAEQGVGIDKSHASQLFSYCQITFTVGRYEEFLTFSLYSHIVNSFIGVVLLKYVDPALLLSLYGMACSAFSLGVAFSPGKAGIGCLFTLFFFESICYPVGLANLWPAIPKITDNIDRLYSRWGPRTSVDIRNAARA